VMEPVGCEVCNQAYVVVFVGCAKQVPATGFEHSEDFGKMKTW